MTKPPAPVLRGAMSGEKLQLDPEPVRHRSAFPHESRADEFFTDCQVERGALAAQRGPA